MPALGVILTIFETRPVPIAFIANTLNEYGVSFVSPVTVVPAGRLGPAKVEVAVKLLSLYKT